MRLYIAARLQYDPEYDEGVGDDEAVDEPVDRPARVDFVRRVLES